MGRKQGGEGGGTPKIAKTPAEQDAIRRATKAGRNRNTKGTMTIEHISGTKLDAPGAIAARRKAAYDKARTQEERARWRKERDEAILRDRKNEYKRKGEALLTLRTQMNEAEDDLARLAANLEGASKERSAEIRATVRRIEGRLRGMQRKAEALETRVNELDRIIFGEKVGA